MIPVMISVVPYLNKNGWSCILCQGQSIQGQGQDQGHKFKAKATAGQSQGLGQGQEI